MAMARTLGVTGLLLLGGACAVITPSEFDERLTDADADGDGFSGDADCDDTNAEVHEVSAWFADADGDGFGDGTNSMQACGRPDGFVGNNEDCDDADADANTSATEICDGVDNNCDGDIDEGTSVETWYVDLDSDGYGDSTSARESCDPAGNEVLIDGDCADSDPTVNPGVAADICNDTDDDCDGETDEDPDSIWYLDDDGDTFGDADAALAACDKPVQYTGDSSDCDDTNSAVHPLADEVCDDADVDEDCDGASDDDDSSVVDALDWFPDADSDGFGDNSSFVVACDQPADTTADDTDCDDGRSDIFPGATEICDGDDNDCDGFTDEDGLTTWYDDADADGYGDPDVSTDACTQPAGHVANADDCDPADGTLPALWYADTDADGFGDGSAATLDCIAPPSHVSIGTDCDDTNAAIAPDQPERCDGAETDEDCDGAADNADPEGAALSLLFWTDADGDGFGDVSSPIEACDPPAGASASADDCNDADFDIKPGAGCPTLSGGFLGLDTVGTLLAGEVGGDRAGQSVAYAGDQDGDGNDDVIVGAFQADALAGAAYVLTAPLSASSVGDGHKLSGVTAGDRSAIPVAGGGDFDGDGQPDVLVGAFRVGGSMGAGYLVQGPIGAGSSLASADVTWTGDAGDFAGRALGFAGDVDGDGADDVVFGAYGSGRTYLITLLAGGDGDLTAAHAVWSAEAAGDEAGRAVAGAGDFDGDGLSDAIIGARAADGGYAYLVSGEVTGSQDLADAEVRWFGEATGDEAGFSVAGVGDTNRDGYADVLVGARLNAEVGANGGAAYLLLGPGTSGSLANADAKLNAEAAGDLVGSSVAFGGDIDLDGRSDLLIGAQNGGPNRHGMAYVVLSPVAGVVSLSAADVSLQGGTAVDNAGSAMAGGGDIDGDGRPDLIIGAPREDSGGADAGAAHIVLGSEL